MLYLATKSYYLHPSPKDIYSYVADNCYVWSSTSTKTKRATLLYIFEKIGIAPSELEIELLPENDATLFDNEDE